MKHELLYKRVEHNDIPKILHLFQNVFKKTLGKKYYINKYKKNNKFNSFIAYNNPKQIIAHVAYSINYLNYNKKKYKIALRFTSMVEKKFQKKGIYKKLLYYSFDKLKKEKIKIILCWPNSLNIIGTNKHENFKYLDHIPIYSKKYNGKRKIIISQFKEIKKCSNSNLKYFFKNRKTEDFSLYKNRNYFIKRYFNIHEVKYLFYTFKNNFIIFTYKNNNEIYITDFLINNIFFSDCLKNFLNLFINYKLIIYLWINKNNQMLFSNLMKYNFKETNNTFNFGYYNLTDKKYSKNYLSKLNYSMGDVDVF